MDGALGDFLLRRRGQKQVQQQIPFGNDSQKSNGKDNSNDKSRNRFASGMTAKKATAKTTATIRAETDSLRG
jgi:hypothetical protein